MANFTTQEILSKTPAELAGYGEGDIIGNKRVSPTGELVPVTTPQTREPIIVSTKQADTSIEKSQATETRITPAPKPAPTPKPEKKEEPKPPVGLSAEEVSTVTDGSFAGYKRQSDGSYLPETALDVADEAVDAQQVKVDAARQEKEDFTAKLKNFDISNDPQFLSLTQSIIELWDSRIREMERANESRGKGIQQATIRMGGRYTELISGGIMAAEERAAMDRIASYEAQKQYALAQAHIAFESKERDRYSELVDIAEKNWKNSVEELKTLNEIAVDEANKIASEKAAIDKVNHQINIDSTVANLQAQGYDKTDIFNYLNSPDSQIHGGVTLQEVSDSLDLLQKGGDLTGVNADLKTFKQFYPDVNLNSDEGRQKYLRWKAQVAAAGRKPETGGGGGESPLSISDIQRYQELYPDAGITAGDTQTSANQKVQTMNAPKTYTNDELSGLITGAKDNNATYDQVITEINNDATIVNKDTAKTIADGIYGKTTTTTTGAPTPFTVISDIFNSLF